MSKLTKTPRIAIVHDRLNVRGGGERVVEEIARLYPKAPIYTLIYDANQFRGSEIAKHTIRTSFIDRLPQAAARHRYYIPLMPLAIEGLELDRFDIIISSSAAFAHGVRTRPDQLHISYIHSPMRYAWHQYKQHVSQLGFGSPPMRLLLAYLRRWDRAASHRATHMLANSHWTSEAITKAFERDSTVIYPPVHVERFSPTNMRGDYYLTASRLVPYKRVDLIVRAFSRLGLPLVVIGDGPEEKQVKRNAAANVEFRAYQPEQQFSKLMNEAKAFVYAAEEDFGIAAVEAQAAGAPVIAFGRGGLTETVIEGKTGLFFDEQSEEGIVSAVRKFESGETKFDSHGIQENAQRFSVQRFREELTGFVDAKWEAFQKAP
jgi:glycosyltransferase involved in cell wall biosynthesis